MPQSERRAQHCRSYHPGHRVHPIQARQAWLHPEHRCEGTVRSVAEDGVDFGCDDGEELHLFAHEPDQVERLVAKLGSKAIYDPRWGLLRFEVPTGAMLVSVSTDPEIGPCSEEERGGAITRPSEGEASGETAARVYAALTDDLRND